MRHLRSSKFRGWYAIAVALLPAFVALYGCGPSAGDGDVARPAATPTQAADTTPPSMPSAVTVSVVSDSELDLNWTASTDNVAVAGYLVYRDGAPLATLSGVTAYQNTGLSEDTAYSYSVQALDAAGNVSPQSTAVIGRTRKKDKVAPSTPTGLVATAVSTAQINLSWAASTDNVAVTAYQVLRGGALVASLGNVTTYQDGSLNANTTYVYTVQALDAAGNASAPSTPASATTAAALDTIPPTTPTNLVGNAVSATQINLSWSPSTDNVAVANYRLYRNSVQVATLTSTTWQDTGRSPATTYTYRADAVDSSGNASGLSAAVTVSTPSAPDTTPPTTPSGLVATAVSDTKINLSWGPSTDNVGVTGYRVIRNGSLLTTLASVTTFQDSGLNAATTYTYGVQALDAAGNVSPQSSAASATTQPAPDTTPPTTPSGVSATAVSATKINVSWSASTDNVAVAGYRLYRDGVLLAAVGNVTTAQDTGLAPGTTHTYNVDAVDAAGNASGKSNSAAATTLSTNTATLAWDAVTVSGLSGYRVYYGTAPGTYLQSPGNGVSVGNVTTFIVTGLGSGVRYYFAVTAFDTSNNESTYSNEAFKDIP